MPRYALLRHDDTVDSVIVAAPDFFTRADPKWLAQFKEWRQITDADTAEPGATFDRAARRFIAPPRAPEAADEGLRAKVREILQSEGVIAVAPRGGGS